MSHKLVGLILIGGRSCRMQQDKAQLLYAGKRQIERCVMLLEPYCESVYISARRAQLAKEQSLIPEGRQAWSFVFDQESCPQKGPLRGLVAGFTKEPHAAFLLLAVDMPLVDSAVIEQVLAQRQQNNDATIFRTKGEKAQPLCGIYENSFAHMIQEHPHISHFKGLLPFARITYLEEKKGQDKLYNTNTAEEYKEAQILLNHPTL